MFHGLRQGSDLRHLDIRSFVLGRFVIYAVIFFSFLHVRDGSEFDYLEVKQFLFWQMAACKRTRYFRRDNVELYEI